MRTTEDILKKAVQDFNNELARASNLGAMKGMEFAKLLVRNRRKKVDMIAAMDDFIQRLKKENNEDY